MFLSIVIRLAVLENSGETHSFFQNMSEVRERQKKIISTHMQPIITEPVDLSLLKSWTNFSTVVGT